MTRDKKHNDNELTTEIELNECYQKFYNLLSQECTKIDPLVVAGTMMALATKLYKSTLDIEDFKRVLYFMADNSDMVEEFPDIDPKTLH